MVKPLSIYFGYKFPFTWSLISVSTVSIGLWYQQVAVLYLTNLERELHVSCSNIVHLASGNSIVRWMLLFSSQSQLWTITYLYIISFTSSTSTGTTRYTVSFIVLHRYYVFDYVCTKCNNNVIIVQWFKVFIYNKNDMFIFIYIYISTILVCVRYCTSLSKCILNTNCTRLNTSSSYNHVYEIYFYHTRSEVCSTCWTWYLKLYLLW